MSIDGYSEPSAIWKDGKNGDEIQANALSLKVLMLTQKEGIPCLIVHSYQEFSFYATLIGSLLIIHSK